MVEQTRTTEGHSNPADVVQRLLKTAGVSGAVLCSRDGDVVGHELPHHFTRKDMTRLGKVMNQSRSGVVASLGKVETGDFRYADHRVLIYYFSKGEVLLLCEPDVKPELARKAVLQQKDAFDTLMTGILSQQRKESVEPQAPERDFSETAGEQKLKRWPLLVAVTALLLIGVAFGYWWNIMTSPPSAVAVETATQNKATPVHDVSTLEPRTILGLHGSNTIGAKLAPELAKKYLRKLGANRIWVKPGVEHDEQDIFGLIDGADLLKIAIQAHGSSTSFKGLDAEMCDIGMASRRIKDKEVVMLQRFGDMRQAASEHVLAMDGIAVIVNPANTTSELNMAQLAGLFSGQINDWSQIPGSGLTGPVTVYARDEKSGTWDTFKNMILKPRALSLTEQAARIEDSRILTAQVAKDLQGIGFIGLPYIKPAKAISVSEQGAAAVYPTPFTVATEDYPLARRLYLYSPALPDNDHTRDFIEFALSDLGQQAVNEVGFVKLTVEEQQFTLPQTAPADYLAATLGAKRLSVTYRFKSGSTELDNRALRDLDRLVDFMHQGRNRYRRLMLFGFADKIGGGDVNQVLSEERARKVFIALQSRGLKAKVVMGLGEAMPVADNATSGGREKNRRVEVWISEP
ncbi:substrate-binding domain-containing protein [uncultured Desulfuromonas sp.]|uniref:substrate-binding domain-containing protein n=1 Tax=uncultured Desulfuromonas sp. TaxID=181013 RepID=UPI002AAC4D27|nr:substrate-binding domain-containing protein [uncultured Desulfuromonas sp.]